MRFHAGILFTKNCGEVYMNKQESDILNALLLEPFINQRILAEVSGHSLGVVNRSLKELIKAGYLNEAISPTAKAVSEYKNKTPKRAIILAAGFGMRMVPINTEMPKGLLEVNGEPLIERIIKQLHEVGIQEIYVVVGFMKEKYEYLMDEYGVELVVNPDYASKNNLHSLKLVKEHLENAYIVPCDIWCDRNPFHRHELYSWYMVSDLVENESNVRVNRKMELVTVPENAGGNAMVGISYLIKEDADTVSNRIEELCKKPQYDGSFWEEALYKKDRMIVTARVVHSADVVEINTYEQLREIDSDSNQLKTDAIRLICKALCAKPEDVTDITVLKKGMTNRSFLFTCKDKKYIMRIPGEGTDQLINRRQEAAVYHAIADKNICDDIAYINPENGYKITEFLEGARVCDPTDYEDVKKCMSRLRDFHAMKLKVAHEFDIFGQMEFYETLWDGTPSVYKDYEKTKANVWSLKPYIDAHAGEKILTHIDAVPDNFLFVQKNGKEEIRLIDWEYAGMQDPHVDIAFHVAVSRTVINIIILLITCTVYTYSLLHGFKGISKLANVCIYLFFGLLAFVLLFGGETRYIIETGFSSLGRMMQNFIDLSTFTDPLRTSNFPQNWTIYYWAYWMVWCVAAPFFIGSISRGRTVRQTILGGYVFGVGSTLTSFIVLGNYSMGLQMTDKADFIAKYLENGDMYGMIVDMIKTMPGAPVVMVAVLITMIAFYATSFDSIALTASCYSYHTLKDDEQPNKGIQLMWCFLLILLPIALLFAESSMNNLQSVSIVAAFPIGAVIVMIAASFLKDAKKYQSELGTDEKR